jgi:ribonuclease R
MLHSPYVNRDSQKNHSKELVGVISTTRKGAGYIDDPDPKKPSIYIEEGMLKTALNGDTVQYRVLGRRNIRGEAMTVGEVVQIMERAKDHFVGIVGFDGGKKIVIADDKKMYTPLELVEAGEGAQAQKDDKVYVKMQSWTDPKKLPQVSLVRILGRKGVNNVEMESIVLEKGFEVGFPKAVEKEAEQIEQNERTIPQEEIVKRRDMRGTETFTIDPFDAKDFDDAISFKKIESGEHVGRYEIGVHIADVSHYVREGSALDKEAVKRGCSVYLVDRTIPMLPEVLSNDVCSLNPHEDKLSFSAIFVMDDKAKIHDRWFGRTVMNSTHRFTYETAQAVIDGNPENAVKYSKGIQTAASVAPGLPYRDQLITLNAIAKVLQKEKFSRGAIEFETQEVKFKLDQNGKPVGVYAYERIDTHKLVEEYMLLANREVARFVFDQIKQKGKRDTGAIYRIHDVPDKDRIKDLTLFVRALGYELRSKDGVVTAHDINHLLDQIEGKPQENLIRIAVLRSMQKAVYSTKNIGHFGLAFQFYTHFTSPIRRYPDLLVHRILAKHLHNEPFGDRDVVAFQHVADSSTRREINAAEAERDSKKLKQVEYMSERLGKVFSGTITGVTKWGMYVEEDESKSEGMIGMRNLSDDYFVFNERSYSIVGERTKKVYTLGDKVKFKAVSADLDKKMLDYVLV